MVAPTSSEGLQYPAGWRVPADQRKKVLAHLGTDEERLERDARSLRAWVNMQPHLPFLPGEPATEFASRPFFYICLRRIPRVECKSKVKAVIPFRVRS